MSYSKLLALLAIPAEDREEFIEAEHEVNGEKKAIAEMSRRELEQAIRERDEARGRVEKSTDEKKRLAAELQQARLALQQAQEQGKTLAGQNNKLTREMREVASRPIDIAVAEPSPARLEALRREGYEQARTELATRETAVLLGDVLVQYIDMIDGAVSLLTVAAGQRVNAEGCQMLLAGEETLRRGLSALEVARNRLVAAIRTSNPDAGDMDF